VESTTRFQSDMRTKEAATRFTPGCYAGKDASSIKSVR